MLAPDVRVVAMDLLRPPPGFQLDQVVLTTYSLDLETLLALPLAVLAHADQGVEELLRDPLLVIEGLREAGKRIHVFVDQDGMAIPRRSRELYALLEPCVHPVAAPNGGAFHPKVWVARFLDADQHVRIRVAILSRNLTFDRCWDVALSSEATPDKPSSGSAPLGRFLRALPGLACLEVPELVTELVRDLAAQVESCTFPAPEEFGGSMAFHALGLTSSNALWRPRGDGLRVLAIAPFLNRTPLDHLVKLTTGPRVLVARQEELDALPEGALAKWHEVFVLADAAVDEGEDETPRPSDLHAKALAIEHSYDVTWWVGSANLSRAAWKGSNVEVMAEITGRKGRRNGKTGNGIHRFFESGFRKLLQPYRRGTSPEDDETKKAARSALEKARQALVQAPLTVECTETDDGWRWALTGALDLPEGVQLRVWPLTLDEKRARALKHAAWTLPMARLTAFVAFVLEVPGCDVDAERLTRKLPTNGLPEGRINHVLRDLISTPERLLRFLRALLGGLEGLVDSGNEGGSTGDGAWGAGPGGDTLLEDLLRAASRDPERLQPVRRLLEDLSQTEEGRRIIPDGLLDTWNAVETAVRGANP